MSEQLTEGNATESDLVESDDVQAEDAEAAGSDTGTDGTSARPSKVQRLEQEGDIAADYLEELLDIADLDGDLDMDVEGDRASVQIVGADLSLAGRLATARCWRRCRS